MKELLVRFIREEEGDVVQNVIIIAIFAALALVFGNTIKNFVEDLMKKISTAGQGAEDAVTETMKNKDGFDGNY